MKLGDTGQSCGLHLEHQVCPQLYWGQYNFIYPFCLFNSKKETLPPFPDLALNLEGTSLHNTHIRPKLRDESE